MEIAKIDFNIILYIISEIDPFYASHRWLILTSESKERFVLRAVTIHPFMF